MQADHPLAVWLGLLTPAELDELAGEYGWVETHLDWRARPAIAAVLEAIDDLIIEQRRRGVIPRPAIEQIEQTMAMLDRRDIQDLFRSYRRMARNRGRDASEPVQRFHAAVGDLLSNLLIERESEPGSFR